jgi:hypothetical protein
LKGTLEILIYSERGITCPHRELVGASNALVKVLNRQAQKGRTDADAPPAKTMTQNEEHGSKVEGDVSSSLWSSWRKLT